MSVSPDTIFSAFDPKPSDMFSFCEPTFGVKPFTSRELAEKYHLSQEYYEQTERILYTASQYYPTTVLGQEAFPLCPDVNKPRNLHVSNMAHCEDIVASHDGERHEVKQVQIPTWIGEDAARSNTGQAKQIELEIIRGWLQSDK